MDSHSNTHACRTRRLASPFTDPVHTHACHPTPGATDPPSCTKAPTSSAHFTRPRHPPTSPAHVTRPRHPPTSPAHVTSPSARVLYLGTCVILCGTAQSRSCVRRRIRRNTRRRCSLWNRKYDRKWHRMLGQPEVRIQNTNRRIRCFDHKNDRPEDVLLIHLRITQHRGAIQGPHLQIASGMAGHLAYLHGLT